MADNYKILAQVTAASVETNTNSNQANIVYTVPANTQASISSISLVNSSATSESYYLGVVKSADVDSSVATTQITTSNPTFVAVVIDSNTAAYSTDGITWTESAMPSFASWNALTYGDGTFVAVGYGTTAAYSTDGITWTQTTMPISKNWFAVTYGNGTFVAVAPGSVPAYSTDGITWQLSNNGIGNWESVTYGDGKFVAIANYSSTAAYSTDGINWTETSLSYSSDWRSVTYGNGKFVALAYGDDLFVYSTDGITWQLGNNGGGNWLSVTYGDGKFVAVTSGTSLGAYSTDGINWTYTTMPSSTSWRSVTYGDGKFVAIIYYSSTAAYSTDGITWTLTSMPLFREWWSLAYGDFSQTTEYSINSIGQAQRIIPTRSIEANTVDEIVGGITLSAGDQIRVYSESPDLIVQVYGVEIS